MEAAKWEKFSGIQAKTTINEKQLKDDIQLSGR